MIHLRTLQRKLYASITLGCWLFAFFVGVAHACGLDDALAHSRSVDAVTDNQGHADDDTVPGCEQFCANDLPLLAKLQSAQDQWGGTALMPRASGEPLVAVGAVAPTLLQRSHPPPGIALYTRFVRLAL